MARQEVERMTFAMIRDLVARGRGLTTLRPYISDDLVMVRATANMAQRALITGKPLRIDDYRCAIVHAGWAQTTINLIEKRIETGMMIMVTPGSIIQPQTFSSDFAIEAIGIQADRTHVALGGKLPTTFVGQMTDRQIHPDKDELDFCNMLFNSLWRTVLAPQRYNDVLNALIAALFHYYDHMAQKQDKHENWPKGDTRDIFERFIRFVNQYATRQHNLDFYASRLCITPRYMSTLIKDASGKTAKEWIDNALATQIKIELKHTDKSIARIAEEMHFPSASFFCRFFKRMTGMTPRQYQDMA